MSGQAHKFYFRLWSRKQRRKSSSQNMMFCHDRKDSDQRDQQTHLWCVNYLFAIIDDLIFFRHPMPKCHSLLSSLYSVLQRDRQPSSEKASNQKTKKFLTLNIIVWADTNDLIRDLRLTNFNVESPAVQLVGWKRKVSGQGKNYHSFSTYVNQSG